MLTSLRLLNVAWKAALAGLSLLFASAGPGNAAEAEALYKICLVTPEYSFCDLAHLTPDQMERVEAVRRARGPKESRAGRKSLDLALGPSPFLEFAREAIKEAKAAKRAQLAQIKVLQQRAAAGVTGTEPLVAPPLMPSPKYEQLKAMLKQPPVPIPQVKPQYAPRVKDSWVPRHQPPAVADDPETSNDESNDLPLGYFGSATLVVMSVDSGNTYTLDAEIDDDELTRLYFPKGGWVDFYDCPVDEDSIGDTCYDEEGRAWVVLSGP